MEDPIEVLIDILDHRTKGISVRFGHEVERTSEEVLGTIGDEELEVGGHVPLDAILRTIDLVAVDLDPFRNDVLSLYLMFISQSVSLSDELTQVPVQGFIGEVHLSLITGIDEVEPAIGVHVLALFYGLLGQDRVIRDLERVRATFFLNPFELPFFREFDPGISFGAWCTTSITGYPQNGRRKEKEKDP